MSAVGVQWASRPRARAPGSHRRPVRRNPRYHRTGPDAKFINRGVEWKPTGRPSAPGVGRLGHLASIVGCLAVAR